MIRRPPRSTLFPYTRSSDLPGQSRQRPTPVGVGRLAQKVAHQGQLGVARPGQRQAVKQVGEGAHSPTLTDRKSTRLNSSHLGISYAVFCLKNKKKRSRILDA